MHKRQKEMEVGPCSPSVGNLRVKTDDFREEESIDHTPGPLSVVEEH